MKYEKIFFCCYALTVIGFIVILDYISNKKSGIPRETKFRPLIVYCTNYYHTKLPIAKIQESLQSCNYKCEFSDEITLCPQADISIFHARDMSFNPFFMNKLNPNRLNIFHSMEAFPNEEIQTKQFPKDFFNATMTFRKDSTIWMPYGRLEAILPHEKTNSNLINEIISKKTAVALRLVSHCQTHSNREKYSKELQKFLNISTYGKCNNNFFDDDKKLIEQHFFYLAFENSICKDYASEKFWRFKELIVPVVLKRSILKGIIDEAYFIAVDDFKSPKELAEKLIYLSKNIDEYKKLFYFIDKIAIYLVFRYFKWTKKFKKTTGLDNREFCKLCEMATKKEQHQIPDIYQWWEKEADCEFSFF